MIDHDAVRELSIGDRDSAAAVLACQRAGYLVEAELMGFDGIPPLHETLDELVVAPRAFRRGHATVLLDALSLAESAERFTVSTGTANIPALALYRRHGFVPIGTREVGPDVTVTLLERRTRRCNL